VTDKRVQFQRMVRLIANVTTISIVLEMVTIITQVARGTTSHFNLTSPLNTFLWMAMGTFIVFVWIMNLLLAILLIGQHITDRAFAWSLRLGVLISFVGMAVAFLMVGPTPAQKVAIVAHQRARIIGAHSVGIADGGPGLPIVGWSTVGGDLRVAHFAGLHALQVLPLLGWLISRRRFIQRSSERQRLNVIWFSGLTYLGAVLLLAWQALRGQSLIHPDSKTLMVAGILGLAAVFSLTVTLRRAQRKATTFNEILECLRG